MKTTEIRYDRETRDYAMYLDGEYVGSARTYHEAEIKLNRLWECVTTGQEVFEAFCPVVVWEGSDVE